MEKELSDLSEYVGSMGMEIAEVVIALVFGTLAIKMILTLVKRLLLISSMDNALVSFFLASIRVLLSVGLTLFCLSTLKIPLGSMIAVLSAAGVAIGLAIQDSIANVANGLVMIGTRPFKVGDYVKIGDDEGTISELRLMNTVLTTRDNRRLILPNKLVFNSRIINYNMNSLRRINTVFSVDYDTDLDEALKTTLRAASSCSLVMKDPAPEAYLRQAGAHSLDIDLWCWCDSAAFIQADYQLQKAVYDAYKKAGIEIPFEQLTLSERPKAARAVSSSPAGRKSSSQSKEKPSSKISTPTEKAPSGRKASRADMPGKLGSRKGGEA